MRHASIPSHFTPDTPSMKKFGNPFHRQVKQKENQESERNGVAHRLFSPSRARCSQEDGKHSLSPEAKPRKLPY